MTDVNGRSDNSTKGPHPQSQIKFEDHSGGEGNGEEMTTEERLERKEPGFLISAPDLLDADLGELQFAVPGLFPHGVSLFAGEPKVGKSTALLRLALTVAQGGKVFGEIPVEQSDVLLMTLEDGPRLIRTRLQDMNVSEVPEALEFTFAWTKFGEEVDKESSKQHLIDTLSAKQKVGNKDYELIIVDTLETLRKQANAGRNIYSEDYQAMSDFREVAHKLDAAVVTVHHENKIRSSDNPYMRVSGSTGLTANADTVCVLSRKRTENSAELHVSGRSIEGKRVGMTTDPEDLSWHMEGPSAMQDMGDARWAIHNALADEDKPRGPKWVSENVPHDYDYVKVEMGRMVKKDQLVKVKRGKYKVVEPDLFQ